MTYVDGPASSLGQAYGLSAFPYWVAVGPSGNVVARLTGELTPDQLDQLAAATRR